MAICCTAGWGSAPGPASADGRSPRDLRVEEFLRTAEVVRNEPVGEGVTGARRLTLRCNRVEARAIFKTIDVETNEVVVTDHFEAGFKDSYVFEYLAYRFDRALGIGLVPVTVLREVDGVEGSVQEWIENVASLTDALAAAGEKPAGDFGLLCHRLMLMYVLDSLISNADRNHGNILVDPAHDRFYLIDHSRSFRLCRKVRPPEDLPEVTVPDSVVERLESLDEACVRGIAGDLLSGPQVKALLARRDRLVRLLGRLGLVAP